MSQSGRLEQTSLLAGAMTALVVLWTQVSMGDEPAGFMEFLKKGRELGEARRWNDAVPCLRQAVALDPENREARFILGTGLIEVGKHSEGLALLETLLEENPANADLRNNIAWGYLKSTDPSVRNIHRALSYARQAVIEQSNVPHLWATLAEAHLGNGEAQLALRSAKVAVALSGGADDKAKMEFASLLRRCEKETENKAGLAENGR